jgi:hypothetical protein
MVCFNGFQPGTPLLVIIIMTIGEVGIAVVVPVLVVVEGGGGGGTVAVAGLGVVRQLYKHTHFIFQVRPKSRNMMTIPRQRSHNRNMFLL